MLAMSVVAHGMCVQLGSFLNLPGICNNSKYVLSGISSICLD